MNIPFLSARREKARRQRLYQESLVARHNERASINALLKTVPGAVYFTGNATQPASFHFPNGTKVEVR